MSEPKQVKVDNWGIYFLQRLKHFFNRTDYCDLTLQFQDNAQLKVHRLVLSACTEYFELLERTCEMYEECLVMPDDLQADVVVPIVNFMYTGQLEFKMDILERLHATSEIMNMPVLTKLLDSHRPKHRQTHYAKRHSKSHGLHSKSVPTVEIINSAPAVLKRSYVKAFEKSNNIVYRDKKHFQALNKATASMNVTNGGVVYRPPSPVPLEALVKVKPQKFIAGEPRPTRYELPDEFDNQLFENSFCNISYTSQPLMVHPTTKQYTKRPKQEKGQPSTSKKSRSTLDIVECKKIVKEPEDNIYEESSDLVSNEAEMFKPAFVNPVVKTEPTKKDPNKLFDQLLDQSEINQSAKVTIETTKNNKVGANLDHAKIISEVLKKYPHLVKSNKNIKLKIFNNPTPSKGTAKRQRHSPQPLVDKAANIKAEDISDYTYETEVLDSIQAAKLIALGAENIEGPWICLICGTPGKALHFTSYYKFRRHLVEVHNEKPVHNICEFCGQRMSKRNHLLHHMFTKHGVDPPAAYRFPKCSQCNYVALTEALLIKHKLSHSEIKNFRCNVCPSTFSSSSQLLVHIQTTGHKYIADRKHSHQCIYCLRVFIRENNLYAHLKTHHKKDAVKDGIIDESDDEGKEDVMKTVKHEPTLNEDEDDEDENNSEYHLEQKPDGNIQLIKKKSKGQKILNSGLTGEPPRAAPSKSSKSKAPKPIHIIKSEHIQEAAYNENEDIVMIDNNEYIMSGNQLILRKPTKEPADEFILSDIIPEQPETSSQSVTPSTSMEFATILNTNENMQQASLILKETGNISETIPIYVSNEEEYKALITSNHNIIFDSSDANKTLTVLTAPEAATLDNSSIDLDNTQSNDVMIMQDEYPLNVTQGATDNSIVVVYSHQVGDANKEYQLLTTQALGPQYAQASAILTHNYETVSTSSPVMTAHILDSQVATWQGSSIQQSTNNHRENSSAVLQSISQVAEVPSMNESLEEISELSQEQLVPDTTEAATINLVENVSNDSQSERSQEIPEVELEQNMSLITDPPIEPPIEEESQTFTPEEPPSPKPLVENEKDQENTQEMVNKTETSKEPIAEDMEHVPVAEDLPDVEQISEVITTESQQHSNMNESAVIQEDANVVTNENISRMDVQNSDSNENIISMDDQNSDTNENIINMDVQNSDTNENINNIVAHSSEANENINANKDEPVDEMAIVANVEPVCSENALNTTEAVEQIQNLTSEWSEDETPAPETMIEAENQDDTEPVRKSEDVEESIENIQQELEKQMGETKPTDVAKTSDGDDSFTNDDIPPTEDKPETSKVVKISSLLNDWDDNDSQEEGLDENVAMEPIKEVSDSNNEVPTEEIQQEVQTLPNDITSQTGNTSTLDDEDDENIENTPTEPETNETTSVSEIVSKQDDIKSLVSDWDDEEEDNKQ